MFNRIFLNGLVCSSLIALLVGCQQGESSKPTGPVGVDPDEDKYHENVYFMDEPPAGTGLMKVSAKFAKRTEFKTEGEYRNALDDLLRKLKDKKFTKSLDKPLDYYCNELDVAILKEFGEVRVGGKVYFNETKMRQNCLKKPENAPLKKAAAAALPERTVWDTQHPYRMVGSSWRNADYGVYKSTGGETMFEKRRSKFFVTAWWGLDADRIGTRIYLFECPSVPAGHPMHTVCFDSQNRSYSDWDSGDDYVSVRDWAVGLKTSFSFNGWVPTGLKYFTTPYIVVVPDNPTESWSYYYGNGGRPVSYVKASDIDWAQETLDNGINYILPKYLDIRIGDGINFINNLQANIIPAIQGNANAAGIASGVLSMHSVKHGSMNFRAVSGTGLRDYLDYKWTSFDFVTW